MQNLTICNFFWNSKVLSVLNWFISALFIFLRADYWIIKRNCALKGKSFLKWIQISNQLQHRGKHFIIETFNSLHSDDSQSNSKYWYSIKISGSDKSNKLVWCWDWKRDFDFNNRASTLYFNCIGSRLFVWLMHINWIFYSHESVPEVSFKFSSFLKYF